MDIGTGILVFQGIMFLAIVGIIIFLVVRRIEEKGEETFEKRDN
jgi:hypothetical protein